MTEITSMHPTVSIVICTYNRAEYLARTIESLNFLDYDLFEVVVVNGPSTDDTEKVLDQYRDRIKIATTDQANLSVSRNIGIRNATGEIVAFIDDDAIPEPNWLHQIVDTYVGFARTGGVGGRVYGPGGDHFQFHNGIIDLWGVADAKRPQPSQDFDPKGPHFNIMMGVNSSFSKKALQAVGGFDEYYEYYHDESDLCVRLTKAGYPIRHHSEASIHHEFARSHVRTTIYHMNWFPIVKNTVYFGIKNSSGIAPLPLRVIKPYLIACNKLREFKQWYREGNITKKDLSTFRSMWRKGVYRGYVDGFLRNRQLVDFGTNSRMEFKRFDKNTTNVGDLPTNHQKPQMANGNQTLGVCLLSQDYPPYGKGGVGRSTQVLAEELAKMGHRVHVLTKTLPKEYMEINGVQVWRIVSSDVGEFSFLDTLPVTKKNVLYSCELAEHVLRLRDEHNIQIVETPLWDYEGLAVLTVPDIHTVVRVETPLRMAAKTQQWKWNEDLELSAQLEKSLIYGADGVIANSRNVIQTIGDMYGLDWNRFTPSLVPLAIPQVTVEEVQVETSEVCNILFVGRLEPRKGVDVLLNAFTKVVMKHPNVRLTLIGDDKIPFEDGQPIRQVFESQRTSPLAASSISFLGSLSDEEVLKAYASCDLFVAPSRYESFGLVFLEAMRFGKPVIGTSVGGIPEVVTHGETGILVEPGNANSLAEALMKLVSDPQERHRLGTNGMVDVQNRFSPRRMAEQTLEHYWTILRA